jgi:hypothetical protein
MPRAACHQATYGPTTSTTSWLTWLKSSLRGAAVCTARPWPTGMPPLSSQPCATPPLPSRWCHACVGVAGCDVPLCAIVAVSLLAHPSARRSNYFEATTAAPPRGLNGYPVALKTADGKHTLLSDNPRRFMSSFIPQFCFYLARDFATSCAMPLALRRVPLDVAQGSAGWCTAWGVCSQHTPSLPTAMTLAAAAAAAGAGPFTSRCRESGCRLTCSTGALSLTRAP